MDLKKIFDDLLENQNIKKIFDVISKLSLKAYEVIKDPNFIAPSADKIQSKDLFNGWLIPASVFPALGWFLFSLARGITPMSTLILKLPFIFFIFVAIPYALGYIGQFVAKRAGGDFEPVFGSKFFTLICLPLYLALFFALAPILKVVPLLIGIYTFYLAYIALNSKDYVPYNEKNMFIIGLLGSGFLMVIFLQAIM